MSLYFHIIYDTLPGIIPFCSKTRSKRFFFFQCSQCMPLVSISLSYVLLPRLPPGRGGPQPVEMSEETVRSPGGALPVESTSQTVRTNGHGTKTGYCCCCFSHSAHWLPTRKKLLYTVAIPARGLLNRGKTEKQKKSGSAPPSPPPARCSFGEKKKKKFMRRIHMSRRYANRRHAGGLGPSRVRTRIPTTRRLGQWVSLRKIQRFRVRLQLS